LGAEAEVKHLEQGRDEVDKVAVVERITAEKQERHEVHEEGGGVGEEIKWQNS